MQLATYAYVNAKTRAMLSSLLDRRTWEQLLNVPDAAAAVEALKGTVYLPQMEEAETRGAGPEVLERVLAAHLQATYRKVGRSFRTRAEINLLRHLLERFELEDLKTALRLWQRKTPDEIGRYLPERLSGGDHPDYQAVAAAHSFDDIIDRLKKTPYLGPLRKVRDKFLENHSLFEVEMALDIDYYERLGACLDRLSRPDRKTARNIIGIEVDIENICWLIRQRKYYALGMGAMLEHVIPGGLRINKETIRHLYSTDGLPQVVASVALGPYAKVKDLVEEDVAGLEAFLQGILLDQVKKTLAGIPFNIGTVLGYLLLKQREIRNLTAVFYAKHYGLKRDKLAALISVE